MIAVRREQEILKVEAFLVLDVTYTRLGETFTVKAGTEIIVDLNSCIALIGDHHVELGTDRFRLGAAE